MLDEKPEINTDGINIAIYTDGSGNMMQQTAWKAVLIVADCAEAVQAGAVGTTANCAVGTTANCAVGTTANCAVGTTGVSDKKFFLFRIAKIWG